jgi:hypothetical protein
LDTLTAAFAEAIGNSAAASAGAAASVVSQIRRLICTPLGDTSYASSHVRFNMRSLGESAASRL